MIDNLSIHGVEETQVTGKQRKPFRTIPIYGKLKTGKQWSVWKYYRTEEDARKAFEVLTKGEKKDFFEFSMEEPK